MQSVLIKFLTLILCILLNENVHAETFEFSKELNLVIKSMKKNKFTKNNDLLRKFINKVKTKVRNEKKTSKDYALASDLLVELNYYDINFYDFDRKFCKKLLIKTKKNNAKALNRILNAVCASK